MQNDSEVATLPRFDLWNTQKDFYRDYMHDSVDLIPFSAKELQAQPDFQMGDKFKIKAGTLVLSLDGCFLESQAVYYLKPTVERTIALSKLESAIAELKKTGVPTADLERVYEKIKSKQRR